MYRSSGFLRFVAFANLSYSVKVTSYLLTAKDLILTVCLGLSSEKREDEELPISNEPAGMITISGALPPIFKLS